MQPQFNPGRYIVRVLGQAWGKSSNGNSQFILKIEPLYVADGDQWQSVPVQAASRTIWLTITDKTVERVAEKLQAIGWGGERWADLDPDTGSCSFVDREIETVCKHEPDFKNTGELREKWDLPGSGQGELENDPEAGKKLDVMFRRQKMNKVTQAKKAPQPAASNRQPATANVGDEDIPF